MCRYGKKVREVDSYRRLKKNDNWKYALEGMMEAYMDYCRKGRGTGNGCSDMHAQIECLDLYGTLHGSFSQNEQ